VSWKVTESRAEETDAWTVTVVDETGSVAGEVRVRIAERASETERPELSSVRETQGRSAVEEALTADPTTLPTEILVGLEGSQPILPGQAPS
jgi:hypothetical protein